MDFDALAETWDVEHGPASARAPEFAACVAILRCACRQFPRPRVLDIGCGTGCHLLTVADLISEGRHRPVPGDDRAGASEGTRRSCTPAVHHGGRGRPVTRGAWMVRSSFADWLTRTHAESRACPDPRERGARTKWRSGGDHAQPGAPLGSRRALQQTILGTAAVSASGAARAGEGGPTLRLEGGQADAGCCRIPSRGPAQFRASVRALPARCLVAPYLRRPSHATASSVGDVSVLWTSREGPRRLEETSWQ